MSGIIDTYAAYSKDKKQRIDSSSGGIFSLLAERVLDKGGLVYGVAMSLDCKYAEYIRVDSKAELSRLRGSKYLQAIMGNTFQQVKTDIDAGLVVLFSGTGCQVNGLKVFLGKEYSNLYCVDVICHGVPSPKLWRQYVQHIERHYKTNLVGINFRCKDDSWSDFGIKRINEKQKAVYISKTQDPFMLMFLGDYCLRPSCYECAAKQDKQSDLSMADFWGINLILPDMNDGNGVSLIMVRTQKGEALFDKISDNIVLKKVAYEEGVRGNRAEYSSAKRPNERLNFFTDMNSLSFEELKNKYAVPVSIPFRIKVKKAIKIKIRKIPILKFIGGGYKLKRQDYGMLFTFEEK